MAARDALFFVLALTGSLSCASHVTAPPPPLGVDIRLDLTTSGGATPGEPVKVQAVIRNAGGVAVDVLYPCPEPYILIYDRQGNPLPQRDPTLPIGCPASAPAPWFEPGSRLEVSLMFDGGYYAANGEHLDAPPGTYFAVATIPYSEPPDWKLKTVTRDVVFTWR